MFKKISQNICLYYCQKSWQYFLRPEETAKNFFGTKILFFQCLTNWVQTIFYEWELSTCADPTCAERYTTQLLTAYHVLKESELEFSSFQDFTKERENIPLFQWLQSYEYFPNTERLRYKYKKPLKVGHVNFKLTAYRHWAPHRWRDGSGLR